MVNNLGSSDNFSYQKAELASSVENPLTSPDLSKANFTDASGLKSRLTLSSQLVTLVHSVWVSDNWCTPLCWFIHVPNDDNSSILTISRLALDRRGKGTFLGTIRANGLEFSFSLISYPPSIFLNPFNNLGYCSTIIVL